MNLITLVVASRDRLDLPGLVTTMPLNDALRYVGDLSEISDFVIKIRPADGRRLTAPKVMIRRLVPSARDRRVFSLPRVLWESTVDGELAGLHATRRAALAHAHEWAKEAA